MNENLVVVSKVKSWIKTNSGLNTASNVADELSKIVACELQKAVENAKRDGRKTVMDRDFN